MTEKSQILVTGGAGYIGSHSVLALCEAGYEPIVVDNLDNSSRESIKRVESIVGRSIKFYKLDIRDHQKLKDVFINHSFASVVHFCGLKAVGESVVYPLKYYENNLAGTITLLKLMEDFQVTKMIFSSSATVYGDPDEVPIKEDSKRFATNPYGRTKLMIEDICFDLANTKKRDNWQIALLRYFNPIGAHESGLIGENPKGTPNNLMPFILKVASGELDQLKVFGGDYPTNDGTGRRDYIHVMDLAEGHVAAIDWLESELLQGSICQAFNLGTGNSVSVLELLHEFFLSTGVKVNYEIVDRREGDIAECYADPSFANQILNWKTKRGLKEMIEDSWKWQTLNPYGYS